MSESPNPESNGAADNAEKPAESTSRKTSTKRLRAAKPRERGSELSTLNFIQPADVPVQAKGEVSTPRKDPRQKGQASSESPNAVERPLDTESMPAMVRERYVQDGHRYLFPSGDRAFEDHGTKLSTPSENTTVVRDLIAIASARGWNEIKIGGTKAFRQEAWRAAKLAGLEIAGYTPTRAEQALLIRALSRRGPEASPKSVRDRDGDMRSERALEDDAAQDPRRGTTPLITGRLLEHGADHYLHDPEEEMSYFVRIKTGRDSEREVWGVDLDRAIRQSLTDVQIGDDIGLRAVERREFRLKTHRRDETGQKVPTEVQAYRNGWIVEQRRFFHDRAALAQTFRDATLRPSDGYRRHPELKGSYLEFQAAKLRFEESVKNPEDRARFLTQLRERMAAAMERGEPLTPVRMRQRELHQDPQKKTSTMPDPEHLLTR